MPTIGCSPQITILWSPAPTTAQHLGPNVKTHRPVTHSIARHFKQWIIWYHWTEVLSMNDVEDIWNNYVSIITEAYNHFFPEKSIRRFVTDLSWITPRISRDRAICYNNTDLYKALSNRVNLEISASKKSYYPISCS